MRWNLPSLSRSELVRLRVKTRRRGIWFRVLDKVERGLVNLAIKVVKRVRSLVLAKSLIKVVKKLTDAIENQPTRLITHFARPLAQKFSRIAQKWGNKTASSWAVDIGFIKYLAIIQKNSPQIFRV